MFFRRTFHPDEANQAFTTGKLLETGVYHYNPSDHHGPTLYYAAAPLERAFGCGSFAEMDGTVLRVSPLFYAILALVCLGGALRRIGGKRAILGLVLLATAPMFVFFSTFFIQEMTLTAFLAMMVYAAARYSRVRARKARDAAFFGVAAGFAFATKETCVFSFASMAIAALVAWRGAFARTDKRVFARHAALAVGAGLACAVVLFSSFGLYPRGVYDAFVTAPVGYLHRGAGDAFFSAGAADHVHAWWWYLELLFDPRRAGWFTLWPLALPLALGARRAWRSRWFRFAALNAGLTFLFYSLVPYKTPWCMLQFASAAAFASMLALRAIPRGWMRLAVSLAVVALHAPALRLAARDPDSSAIPFNYANASPEAKALADWVGRAFIGAEPGAFAAVALPPEDTWPFPWYNREREARTGHWTSFDDLRRLAADGRKPVAVVVPMTEGHLVQPLFPHLKETARFFMRPGVRVRAFR